MLFQRHNTCLERLACIIARCIPKSEKTDFKARFHVLRSDCVIQVAAGSPSAADYFSFKQVRDLAMDIIEYCQDHGGHGGRTSIGVDSKFAVQVFAFQHAPPSSDVETA